MRSLLFFARDPGAADAILPLYKEYQAVSTLWLKDYARATGERSGCTYDDLNQLLNVERVSVEHETLLERALQEAGFPKAIITGTTHFDDYTDRLLWKIAARYGIPTIAVLDHTIRVRERFETPLGRFIPDHVLAPNRDIVRELENAGLVRKGAVPIGLMTLATALTNHDKFMAQRESVRGSIQEKFQSNFQFLVVYASEPQRLLERQGAQFKDSLYDQVDVYRFIYSALKRSNRSDILLVTKLHPKEDGSEYRDEEVNIISSEISKGELLASADVVIGTKSMLQLEALLYECSVVGIDLWNNTSDQLHSHVRGLSTRITSSDDLVAVLRAVEDLKPAPLERVIEALDVNPHWRSDFREVINCYVGL